MQIVQTTLNQTYPRFYVCSSYLQLWWRSNQKWSCYHPDYIFTIICPTEIKWQVTLVWIVRSPRNPTRPKLYGCPHYLHVWWRFSQKWNRYCPDNIFLSLWGPQARVTLMPTVETWPKSKSEILCPSSLSASLMKILSQMKSLSSGQQFPNYLSVGD